MDPSEAGVEVMEAQLRSQDPLESDEQVHSVGIESSWEPTVAEIAAHIAEKTNPVRGV
jgi:hypothetical protein